MANVRVHGDSLILPEEIRKELHLTDGDTVSIHMVGTRAIMQKGSKPVGARGLRAFTSGARTRQEKI